jgi:hypothetical protein
MKIHRQRLKSLWGGCGVEEEVEQLWSESGSEVVVEICSY